MASHSNNNSTSQYLPFSCVYGSESQPLLGHHSHPHQSLYQQQNEGEYRVDVHDEKCDIAPREVSPLICKNTRRRKLLGRLCALMFLGWIYYAFIHKDNYKHHHGNHTDVDSHTTPRNINSPQGSIGYNHCEVDAIDWDGPSIFTTDASNFNLKFGKGSFGSYVQVHQGAVSQPTLRIEGMISPMESVLVKNEQDGGRTISIWHLGLHIEIREDPELFDVLVWFEDRTVVADDGYGYRACATLDIAIILLIDGAVTKINMYNLDKIRFRKLDLETAVGNVIGNDLVLVDEFLVRVKTGKVEICCSGRNPEQALGCVCDDGHWACLCRRQDYAL
ncbi:hypothetical protein EDD21DRAFT_362110, partial [Dissophora ornata]